MNSLMRHRLPVLVPVIVVLTLFLSALLPAALPVAAAGSIQLSRTLVAPRDSVTATGSGFTPGDNAVVYADFRVQGTTHRVQTAVSVNAGGGFSTSLTVPAFTAEDTYAVRASDFHGHTAAQNLRVLRVVYLKAGGSPQTINVIAGHHFFLRGSGFQAGEKIQVSATFPLYNGNSVTVNRTVAADKNGAFWDLLLPVPFDTKAGKVTLTASGQASKKSGTAIVNAIYRPTVSLSSSATRPGGAVTVHGQGFVPGASITVSITIPRNGTSSVTLNQVATADQYGRFSTALALPSNTRPGTYTVTAKGSVAGFTGLAHLAVAIKPTISLSSGTVSPGQTITVTGGGYSANVQVTIRTTFSLFGGGSRTVSTTETTNGDGAFSAKLAVPGNAAAGTVLVIAQGPNGQASARLQLRPLAVSISASPPSVAPGGTAIIRGSGFLANGSISLSVAVTLTNGSSQTLSTSARTNGSGQFAAALHIPRNVRGGNYTVVARGTVSGRSVSARLLISRLAPSISVAPASAIPGANVTIRGAGYLPNARVMMTVTITLTNGKTQTLSTSATTNGGGQFTATIHIPGNAAGGSFALVAKSENGRFATTHLTIAKLAPSIVATPTTAVPGTPVTVNGFGFAAGANVTISLNGQKVGTATANGSGQFSLKLTLPASLASGSYTLSAVSNSGRKASIGLTVNRLVSTHFYFASFYTGRGYHEYLAFLNPTDIHARVTISYQLKTGAPRTTTIGINAHSRFTEDVNADLGYHVSAGAVISADVPIVAERMVFHGTDGSIVPGASGPSTVWYFANGNTGRGYREYIAINNPNSDPVQVAFTFYPTHRRAFTVYRGMAAASRTTLYVNKFVHRDAVGVRVTANGPVVANRTIFIHHGMTSKIGVTAPQRRWYFAAGPLSGRNWIGATNPSNHWAYVTLHAYGPAGLEIGTAKGWLRPYARVGYLINRIAHQADAAVVLQASRPIVAEQVTYAGRMHDASTDTFGTWAPAKNWTFAAVSTLGGRRDVLDLFNPNLVPIPVVVDFMTTSGSTVQRTYVVAPFAHQRVDVGSVEPNAQLGIAAASNYQFVAMNRAFFAGGLGSMTSSGIHL